MLTEIGIAVGVTLVAMVLVGLVVKTVLGLRSFINWMAQTGVLYGVATVAGFTTLQLGIVLALPAVIHVSVWLLKKIIMHRVKEGAYGEEAKWAAELFAEGDREFVTAQAQLSKHDVREVRIIADSKDELRSLMLERYEERREEAEA